MALEDIGCQIEGPRGGFARNGMCHSQKQAHARKTFASVENSQQSKKGKIMKIKERQTQKIYPGKWEDLEAIDKKYNQLESGVGFPPKKRYRLALSSESINILVVEREWDSFADFEKAYEKVMTMP